MPAEPVVCNTGSTSSLVSVVALLNAVLRCGGPPICEAACLVGTIPAVLPLTQPTFPLPLRLLAATFTHTMCTCSSLTLQMTIACGGLPVIVTLLDHPSRSCELATRAIDVIKAILDLKGRSPRNDLARCVLPRWWPHARNGRL